MDISKQLSTLLKFHECVIIPDFGGFISNYVPSWFDPARNVFMPPSKEIVFNSKINKNDGLLINHLVESEGVGYSEAHTAVSNWVNAAFDKLNNGQRVEFSGVGSLVFDRFGSYVFNPSGENMLAEAYGLEEVSHFKYHNHVQTQGYQPRPAIRALNHKNDFIRIAAGIALLVSLSIIPVKKENSNFLSSNLNPFSILNSELTDNISGKEASENSSTDISTSGKNAINQKLHFILVGGSFEIYQNALAFRDELLREGNHPEIFEKKNGLYKVIIDSYNNKNEALNAMENYRENHPGSQVWVSTR
jgi:hypothetical protein